jgi:hypothetical protein
MGGIAVPAADISPNPVGVDYIPIGPKPPSSGSKRTGDCELRRRAVSFEQRALDIVQPDVARCGITKSVFTNSRTANGTSQPIVCQAGAFQLPQEPGLGIEIDGRS